MVLESGDHAIESTQRSKFGITSMIFPVARSYSISRKRSLSYPPRNCERYAMYFPSGEYSGVESLPGFVVIFFGVPPATGTIQISLLVLVACTSSMLLVYATSLLSDENEY